MQRILGLLRDTWIFWVAFLLVALVCAWLVDIAFLAAIPISIFSITYFSAVRYDEHGRPKK